MKTNKYNSGKGDTDSVLYGGTMYWMLRSDTDIIDVWHKHWFIPHHSSPILSTPTEW